jgi:prophage maintenance system killer protein
VLAIVLVGFGAFALITFLVWSGQRMTADENTNVETSVSQAELEEKDLGYEY